MKYRTISEWYAFGLCLIGIVLFYSNVDTLKYIGLGIIPSSVIPIIFHIVRKNFYFKITDSYSNSKEMNLYTKGLAKLIRSSIKMIYTSLIIFACVLIFLHFNSGDIMIQISLVTYFVLIIPFLYFEKKMLSLL